MSYVHLLGARIYMLFKFTSEFHIPNPGTLKPTYEPRLAESECESVNPSPNCVHMYLVVRMQLLACRANGSTFVVFRL